VETEAMQKLKYLEFTGGGKS